MAVPMTSAHAVEAALTSVADEAEAAKIRQRVRDGEPVIGVRMGTLFDIAKAAVDLPDDELDRLFDHPTYEPRMVAFCVLDFRARRKLPDAERIRYARKYLDRHDAITAWDMVDRAAPRVIGWPLMLGLLGDAEPFLISLARSGDPLRRRTAITAPLWFIKRGTPADIALGSRVADLLEDDPERVVRTAVATYRRHAGRR